VGADTFAGVRTLFYHFNKTNPYDVDLDGNPLYNAITVEQEQRAREILDIYSNLLGVQFVETESTGIWIKTGQFGLQIWMQFQEPSRPGGIMGVGGPSGVLMDIAENWDNSYNGNWFDVAFHELGHTLGLGHTYELPPGTVMGSDSRLRFGQNPEPVWPGLQDLVHGRMLHRPESKDIDMYRFEVPAGVFGTLTAETIAERLLHSSSLDTLLRLYRENPDGTTELLAQNDAYFSRDSYLELELGPGVYYIGVSASGNGAYDPTIADSGYGGTSEGLYELKLNFRPAVEASIVDLSGTPLDGNLDGTAGGVFDFWFQTRPHERVVGVTGDGRAYVDGQVLTIEDALGNIRRFEFDSNSSWTSGRIRVPFQAGGTPTSATQMATELADLINNSGLVGVTATVQGTRIVLTGERSAMLSSNALGLVLEGKTIFVDKTGGMNLKGTLDRPFHTISSAFAAAVPGDIVRIVGNGGLDGRLGTQGDNHAYEIGTGMLQDGATMEVPRGVTTMIDAGALFKLRSARIAVGSSPSSIDRSNASLQVLGIPDQRVIFTSYNDESLGVDTNPLPTVPERGDWGGIEFRRDVDVANGRPLPGRQGIFLDHVNHAQIQYGGGQVQVDSDLRVVNPIHIIDARPTVTFNVLTRNADAAISATPDSFAETNFNTVPYQLVGTFTADYTRVGPKFAGNWIVNNSTNGVRLNIGTAAGQQPRAMTVSGRFDDTDIVYVIPENLELRGVPSGAFRHTTQPAISLVAFSAATGAGALPAGTYRYRVAFTDAAGYEGAISAQSAAVTVGANGRITLNNLPPAPAPFAGRRLYRSSDGGTTFTLVAELDKTRPTYVDTGVAMGGTFPSSSLLTTINRPRTDGRLVVDPGAVVKLQASRIEAKFGSYLIAEGIGGYEVIFTSRQDDRYGAGGTFDTNDDVKYATDGNPNTTPSAPQPGNWGGIYVGPMGSLSMDQALVSYAGGVTAVGGTFSGFNAVELHQPKLARITNSKLERNASGMGGQLGGNRDGYLSHEAATIFVRGAHPIIVNNVIRDNTNATPGTPFPVISINVNSLGHETRLDHGRARGPAQPFSQFVENQGPLVRLNQLDGNQVNGMAIRGETLQTAVVWDDTDIVHVMNNTRVFVPDFHTYGGLLLKSNPTESLVIKLQGNAGFVSTGRPLDIVDRIGGILQVAGQPGFPVVFTSLADDSIGAGFTPSGAAQRDTNGNGPSTGAPGQWNGILIDQYSHDRNVEIILERESPDLSAPGDNATPATAQFIGSLAPNEKAGDETLRLGFVIKGLLNVPADVDVYSFDAAGGTEIWLDIDHTTMALDSVVELIDAQGNVLARSVNSAAETANPALLYNGGLPENHVNPLQKRLAAYQPRHASGAPKDHWTTNPRDAGMRVVLPGAVGSRNLYHVRVRSNSDDLNNLSGGLTSGNYELQIRLRETDELAGSTVRYADIRYSTYGIQVRGMPIHSPLTGEGTEVGVGTNTSPGEAGSGQDLGNLLNSDRAALSVSGSAAGPTDVDFYRFMIRSDSVQAGAGPPMATIFDLDYADGLGRPDFSLYVFDSQGRLILMGLDSNIAEDQPGPGLGIDMMDLTRGSAGILDPYIGTVHLPAGEYHVAVSTASQIPSQMQQFQLPNPPNPLVRVEPINSIRRIAEDRIGSSGGSQVAGGAPAQVMDDPSTPAFDSVVPYHLGDIVLFVSQSTGYATNTSSTLATVNPFTGFQTSRNGSFAAQHRDIAMRPDGQLFTFSTGPFSGTANQGNIGNFLFVDTGTGQTTSLNDDGIDTFWRDGAGNVAAAGNAGYAFEAMAFSGNTGTNLYAIGNRIGQQHPFNPSTYRENVLYRFNAESGVVVGVGNNREGDARADQGAGTVQREIGEVRWNPGTGLEPLPARITGMEFVGGTLWAVDEAGFVYTVSTSNAVATFRADLADKFGLTSINVQGLTRVPTGVENGRYESTLMAITSTGVLHAFYYRNDTSMPGTQEPGDPAPIFVDGQSSVTTGITNVRGLAFSTLHQNPWHTTNDRWSDPGHGVAGVPGQTSNDPVFDNSRFSRNGGASLFFGIEDPNDNWANNLLYRSRTETGGQRAPGGAHGTLISRPFSLQGYSPEDRPTLYFTYYLDTENARATLTDTQMMVDSFRVYVAGEDGIWHPLGTNNSARAGGSADDEYDFGYYVQPLFDIGEDGAPNSWRQARITLSPFAGQENLRLRFEFSTAGGQDLGHAQTTGDELYSMPGSKIRDGETFRIGTTTFEFDMGYTIVTPTGANLKNGDSFSVTNAAVTRTFTFVNALTVPAQPGEILIATTDSADAVATKVVTALRSVWNAAALPIYRNGNRLNIPSAANLISAGLPEWFQEGRPGVAPDSVQVSVHAGMPAYDLNNANNALVNNDVRAQIVQALARTFNVAGQNGQPGPDGTAMLNLSSIKTHNDMIRVIGRNVMASGPLGWARQPNGQRGLTGDRFGLSYQQRPWSATTLWNASGTASNYSAARRGMNNAIQGVYIDDIIIGFAERGEMVTGASTGATTFVGNNAQLQPSSATGIGSYQLEIRRGASYLDFDTFDAGDRPFHSRSFDTNARLAQQVTLIAPAGREVADGQTFDLSDGVNTLTFEYDDIELRSRINIEGVFDAIGFDWHSVPVLPPFFSVNVPYPMPSPTVAVGTSRALALANTTISLFNKDGSSAATPRDLRTFFPNEQPSYQPGPFQPSAIYDRDSDRFILIATDSNAFGDLSSLRLGSEYLLIAVSKTGNPSLISNDWHFYSIPTTHDFGAGLSGIYYPKLAADSGSLYITGNYFHLANNSPQGTIVTRLEKQPLLDGVLGGRWNVVAEGALGLQPVQSVGRSPNDPQLFVDIAGIFGVRVWEMDDANVLSIAQTLISPFDLPPDDVPQAASSATLQTMGPVLTTAVWRNDSLWTAHAVGVDGDATVRWYQIATTAGNYGIQQQGTINPGSGVHTFMPAINVDAAGNMAITYTQTSGSIFPRMMVSGREAALAPGATEQGVMAATSTAPFDLDYTVTPPVGSPVVVYPPGGSEFWGDAAGLALDPVDDSTFWAMGEVAASHATYGARWDTKFAKFYVGPAVGGTPGEGVAQGHVRVPFDVTMTEYEIAAAIRNAINSPAAQNVLQIRAGLSDGGGSSSTSNRINLYGTAAADRHGSQNFAINRVIYGLDIPDQFDLGDQNIHREQGQLLVHSNIISHAQTWGIIIDAGLRGNTQYGDIVPLAGSALPHPGSIRNLRTPNNQRLAPGPVVSNNIVAHSGQGGILFSGDPVTNNQAAPVPFGRIVNNTVFGNRAGDVGIRVQNNAGPTLLNNAVANLGTGVSVDGTSLATTVVGATLYWNNASNAPSGVGDFAIIAPAGISPFVNAPAGNFYPAPNSPLIDSSVPWLADRTTFVDVKTPHGLGVLDPATGRYSSRIVAPTTDVHGQLRVDDPNVDTPPSQAVNSIIDRGAVDRADWFPPTAQMLNPLDNDAAGRDRDPNPTVISILENQLPYFAILLSDGTGVGVDSATVTAQNVTVTQNRALLTEGVHYTFGYNPVNNTDAADPVVPDLGAEQRLPDHVGQQHDPGPRRQPTAFESAGRQDGVHNHPGRSAAGLTATLPIVSGRCWPATARGICCCRTCLTWARRSSPTADGSPTSEANAHADDDGVDFSYVTPAGFVHPGVFNVNKTATPITITVGSEGWVDGWVDFNGNQRSMCHRASVLLQQRSGRGCRWTRGWAEQMAGRRRTYVMGRDARLDHGAVRREPNATPASASGRTGRDSRPPRQFLPTGLVLGGEVEDYTVSIVRGRPPVAVNDSWWIFEDPHQVSEDEIPIRYRTAAAMNAPYTVTPNVLLNDTDPDGDLNELDKAGAVLVRGPLHARPGSFKLHPDGTFEYHPVENFHGVDTFTYRAIDSTDLISNNVATVTITIQPKNDPPALRLTATGMSIEEDTGDGLRFNGVFSLSDLDNLLTPGVQLQVTLDVLYGGLLLNTTTGLTWNVADWVPADPDTGPFQPGTYQRLVVQGTIAALNTALDDMRYFGSRNFNTGLEDERLVIHVDDRGNVDIVLNYLSTDPNLVDPRMIARATLPITVLPTNDAPVITIPDDLDNVLDEDDPAGLLLVAPGNIGITVDDLDDLLHPDSIQLQVTVSALFGGLEFGDLFGTFLVSATPAGATGWEPYRADTFASITIQGTIAELNLALATLRYWNNADFNTGTRDEVVTIHVNDLGNVDYRTGTPGAENPYALTDTKTVAITVRPKQDDPTIPTVPGQQVADEDTPLALPAFQVFDVDVRSQLVVTGGTVVYDPDWVGTVTITVLYGTVWLSDPSGVAYSGGGTREMTTVTIIVNPKQDTPEMPVVPGDAGGGRGHGPGAAGVRGVRRGCAQPSPIRNAFEYDPDWVGTVTITVLYGTVWLARPTGVIYTGGGSDSRDHLDRWLGCLNNALRDGNVRYQGDPDFNSRNWLVDPTDSVPHDTLTIRSTIWAARTS
jgi:hypothetical protein